MNILIITYDWPPRNSIACHRMYSWAKYWIDNSNKITILTAKKKSYDEPLDLILPNIEGLNIVEIEYGSQKISNVFLIKKLKKLKAFINKFFLFTYDPRIGWFNALKDNLDSYAFDNDIVISSYPVEACHLIAHKIKDINPKIFWVADYRDMWSISHLSKPSKALKRKEVKTVGVNANLITTISNELSIELSTFLNRKVHTITNGFDMSELQLSNIFNRVRQVNDPIKIVYTGMIYPGRRDPTLIISAIINIEKKYGLKNKFELHFYGSSSETIKNFINIDNQHFIKQCGHVSRDMSIKIQNSADFVLLLESEKEDAKGILTGKIFEYMFSGTPIISNGSIVNSAIWKVINSTKTGKCYIQDIKELENDLLLYSKNKKIDWYQPEKVEILKYTRKKQAEILFNLIINEYKIKA
jgi:glycosyltransferase involved in cell wall biosynthesis